MLDLFGFEIKLDVDVDHTKLISVFCLYVNQSCSLVSDLLSTAFIKALRRFVAIRGRCTRLYSDNG